MTKPGKLFIEDTIILWPSLFVPSKIDREDDPKYRASFMLPENYVPPKWVFVKTSDGKYNLPVGARFISTQSLNPMPVFGMDDSLIREAARTMQKVDKALYGAQADVILTPWEGRNGSIHLIAEAIRVKSALALPTFEKYLGDM